MLRPLSAEQLPFLVDLNSDPEVLRYLFAHPFSARETEERMHRWLGEARDGLGMWVGHAGQEPIGLWMLMCPEDHRDPRPPRAAELGYRLPQRNWRQGYAGEGSRALLRHGFTDLGLDRVYAETMAANAASRATMSSVGLRQVRSFHGEFEAPLPGADQGDVVYEITREEWVARAG